MNNVDIFKPGIAELKEIAEKHKNIVINGVTDEAGYALAKDAKKELADWRIKITKAGKGFREEALAYQREVLRQEKELLEVISPVEEALKAKISAVDEEKARTERIALLPNRKALLAEISVEMTDDELLALDEQGFSEVYTSKKIAYLEAREAERVAAENEKRRQEELEKAKEEAANRAVEEERARAERESQAKEAEAKRLEEEKKAEARKLARNKQYKEWLEKNGASKELIDSAEFLVQGVGNAYVLYKRVDKLIVE